MNTIQQTVDLFLRHMVNRDLVQLLPLFAEHVDWYIPGDERNVPWLGRRGTRVEIGIFYEQLWRETEPVLAGVEDICYLENSAVIAGSFSTKMLRTGRIVTSPFCIRMRVDAGAIVMYRLLEDSFAVSEAMRPER